MSALPSSVIPLRVPDIWVAKSILQKAIRRNEPERAAKAAITLLGNDPAGVWNRMMVIAFEDVGIGSLEAVHLATAATSAKWRKAQGGDWQVAIEVARQLAMAPKCRATEGLAGAAANHPALEPWRRYVKSVGLPERLAAVADSSLTLPERALAAWYSSGVDHWRHHRVGPGDLPGLMATYQRMGVSPAVLDTTASAIRKVKEPILVMLPLLSTMATGGSITEATPPPTFLDDDVPLVALDMFCRIGKQAIAALATSSPKLRDFLYQHLPRRQWARAVGFALFYAEGGIVTPHLRWAQSMEIERLGIEADFATVGLPAGCIAELLALVREDISLLNHLRIRQLDAGWAWGWSQNRTS